MQALQEALINLLVVVIGVVASFLGQQGVQFLKKNGVLKEIESKKAYAKIVVNAIQQTYKEADGDEKLSEAKNQLIKMFSDNGIAFSSEELDSLIEAAVRGAKEGVSSGK